MFKSQRGFASTGVLLIGALVVVVLVVAVALFNSGNKSVEQPAVVDDSGQSDLSLAGIGGNIHDSIEVYKKGIGRGGNYVSFTADVEINAGENQKAWTNTTGRTVYIKPNDVTMGYTSGTASSSWLFFVSTSTAASVTDYSRPSPTTLLIDGAIVATSTGTGGGPITVNGTSTSAGTGFAVPHGSRVIFNVQERYACKTIGACETATSTNRGVTKFFGTLTASYRP